MQKSLRADADMRKRDYCRIGRPDSGVRAMRDGLLDLLVSWIVRHKWSATNQLR
jgi:hypothetical protein